MSKSDSGASNRTNVNELLPEVYRSNFNNSFFGVTVNRLLSPDDTTHVSGYIGRGRDTTRRIKEKTYFRQANQLQPMVLNQRGSEQDVLTFPNFVSQMKALGVDFRTMDQWGSAEQFSWAPPINLDKLVNYGDYYWESSDIRKAVEYVTIENWGRAAEARVVSYEKYIGSSGEELSMVGFDVKLNEIHVSGYHTSLFVDGFLFFTRETTDVVFNKKYWTAESSSFDADSNVTKVKVVEPIGSVVVTTIAPGAYVGEYVFSTYANVTYVWTGIEWKAAQTTGLNYVASLKELLEVLKVESDCINGYSRWDTGLFDDNSATGVAVAWSQLFLASVSFPSESDWVLSNGAPVLNSVWYNTTNDTLNAYNGTNWVLISGNFSTIVAKAANNDTFDIPGGCPTPTTNEWTEANFWRHKTQVRSYVGSRNAQIPIIEYSDSVELNEWVETTHVWKYRSVGGSTFVSSSVSPSSLELQPISAFSAMQVAGAWKLFMVRENSGQFGVDYGDVFIPGFKFVVRDSVGVKTYTVSSFEYRTLTTSERSDLGLSADTTFEELVSIVEIVEGYSSSSSAQIIPFVTSMGDAWLGYNIHWLYVEAEKSNKPTGNKPENRLLSNPFQEKSYSSTNFGIVTINRGMQGITVGSSGTTRIPLDLMFRRAPSSNVVNAIGASALSVPGDYTTVLSPGDFITVKHAAKVKTYSVLSTSFVGGLTLINTNEELDSTAPSYLFGGEKSAVVPSNIRVYKNGIRVYGDYQVEVVDGYASAVVFNQPLRGSDNVVFEVCSASQMELDKFQVPVRTIESDVEFQTQQTLGTQPVLTNVQKYAKFEQTKTQANQYPRFNVFSIRTNDVVKASSIFEFAEDSAADVNLHISKRITVSSTGDYSFVQTLLDEDNGMLRAYRNVTKNTDKLWYNPDSNKVYVWSGKCWCHKFFQGNGTPNVYVDSFVVSSTEPTSGNLWYNPTTNVTYGWTGANFIPTTQTVIVSKVDPTLETIWKKTDSTPLYVPKFVDENGVETSSLGDWEFPKQWINNPSHENRTTISLVELDQHFRSIISSQKPVPGQPLGGYYTLLSSEFDYGVGGTIKEYQFNYDSLISAINSNTTNPTSVIEFARSQYGVLHTTLKDAVTANLVDALCDYSMRSIVDQQSVVLGNSLRAYETNDFLATLYGDSSTRSTIRNWIATLPVLGFKKRTIPFKAYDETNQQHLIYCHDGHWMPAGISKAEVDVYARRLVNVADSRVPNGKMGAVGHYKPTTQADFETILGEIRPGVYFYAVISGVSSLYRLNIVSASEREPIPSIATEGQLYYNKTTKTLYKQTSMVWSPTTTIGDQVITSAWKEIDLSDYVASVTFDVEQRLFLVSKDEEASVVNDVELNNPTAYAQNIEKQFTDYVQRLNVKTPYTNTEYNSYDSFTWNYANSDVVDPPHSNNPGRKACWQALYEAWFNTPYPHFEPWKLQGFENRPDWWNSEYADTSGTRLWKVVGTSCKLWDNILQGVVPAGYALPSGLASTGTIGEVQQYAYVPVNITLSTVGMFKPDAILPPYLTVGSSGIRSLFTSYGDVVTPNADFVIGMEGPIEWQWKSSSAYEYDRIIAAFKIEPIRVFGTLFDTNSVQVNGLSVNMHLERVLSHKNVIFHGDIVDGTKTYDSYGLNQWYVNYNRYCGFDTNAAFRDRWTKWDMKVGYLTGGILDTDSLSISNRNFEISTPDYGVLLANVGLVNDVWVDALRVSVTHIPPKIIQYNNQHAWKLSVDTLAGVSRELVHYGVKKYPTTYDAATGEFVLYSTSIVEVLPSARVIALAGDMRPWLDKVGGFFTRGTTSDGGFAVETMTYDFTSDVTRIVVDMPVLFSAAEGFADFNIPMDWNSGDAVVLTSTKLLPYPFEQNAASFVIKTGPNRFTLAIDPQDAVIGANLEITGEHSGQLYVGKISTTFNAFNALGQSQELWFHYELDKTDVRMSVTPFEMNGIQNLIDFADGVAAWKQDSGIDYRNNEFKATDPDTGRYIDWQLDLEKMIEQFYLLRATRLSVSDTYAIEVADIVDNTLRFTNGAPAWENGTAVSIRSNGQLPTPLLKAASYYISKTGMNDEFKLCFSPRLTPDTVIDIQDVGSGNITLSATKKQVEFPTYTLNPSRYSLWVDTPTGILSNVLVGPYNDIRARQTVFDQTGFPVTTVNLLIYRNDKKTLIQVTGNKTPDEFLEMGGSHLFVEGYEHVILLNNYTVGGYLVYDSFLGIKQPRLVIDAYKSSADSMRPSLGGFYMNGHEFRRNIEGQVNDLRNLYDTYRVVENRKTTQYARDLLGYRNDMPFLDTIDVNSKSKFAFYRGMIQHKGASNAFDAYINYRQFDQALVDECWAYKQAEFGSKEQPLVARIKLKQIDRYSDDIKFVLATDAQYADASFQESMRNVGYAVLSIRDSSRWSDYPIARSMFDEEYSFARVDVLFKMSVYVSNIQPSSHEGIDYWYNVDDNSTSVWNGSWTNVSASGIINNFYVRMPNYCDGTFCQLKQIYGGNVSNYQTVTLAEGVDYTQVTSSILELGVGIRGIVTIYGYGINGNAFGPCRVYDNADQSVVTRMGVWNPASGLIPPQCDISISRQVNRDPASYNRTVTLPDNDKFWNLANVGEVWLDTSYVGYAPYYDRFVEPDENNRLYSWGKLAPWGEYRLFKWIESSAEPEQHEGPGTPRQVLYKRARKPHVATFAGGNVTVAYVGTAPFADGNNIIFVDGEMVPSTIGTATKYVVGDAVDNGMSVVFSVYDTDTGDKVTIDASYSGTASVVKEFEPSEWVEVPPASHTFDIVTLPALLNPTLTLPSTFTESDNVDVWKNNKDFVGTFVVDENQQIDVIITLTASDSLTVVKQTKVLSDEEEDFDPDIEDDGTINEQYRYNVPFSSVLKVVNGTLVETFCFWVEGDTTADEGKLSPLAVVSMLNDDSRPYVVMQDISVQPDHASYNRMVVRNVSGLVTYDDRFELRVEQSRVLRNNLRGINGDIVKNRHTSWKIIRRSQIGVIDRYLWDKLTESMMGEKMNDSSIRVPSLEREVYDIANGTSTRIGLDEDQTFVDGSLAKTTVMEYLTNNGDELNPFDAARFLEAYNFNTPANTKEAMDALYKTFSAESVNNIWFNCLEDAISQNAKYKEFMKTSWLVAHGIQVINVGGIFDDI